MTINQFRREYERKDYSQDELENIKEHLESHTPNSPAKAKENELRIQALDDLLS